MKNLMKFLTLNLLIFAIIGFSSCEKKNSDVRGYGKLEISLNFSDQTGLKSLNADSIFPVDSIIYPDDSVISPSYQIILSVEDLNGESVFSDKFIPLYNFGPGFISDKIEIPVGKFKLTKFMVINPSGKVIFAAPLEGSPLSYLVNNPLPLNFRINPEAITRILPEVLEVAGQSPDQFGYAGFGIQIVEPLTFYALCMLDNPMIMAPTQITNAKLTVYAKNGWHYTFNLQASVNRIIIRGGSEVYKFVLEKEGYESQYLQFTAEILRNSTKENPLILKIPWVNTEYRTLILQPGPDGGKDAMISNLQPDKNFGSHKYFEATFLTEPVLTVMRSNRSLIWFNMNALPKSATIRKVSLNLMYDIPIPWDSSIYSNSPVRSDLRWYGAVLQQITEPWEEGGVTWNNQPKSIEANQVYMSPFIKNANFIEIDVTSLFVPLQEILAPNYGMMFKLWPEDNFPGFRFASSDYSIANMRPKLIIQYTLPI